MLADIRQAFGGFYRMVADELLSLAENPEKAVAPVDVVCEVFERNREDLQDWYDQALSNRIHKLANKAWHEKLLQEHEERMEHSQREFRHAKELRSMKGRHV